jgi:hypothetical protein
MMERRRPQRKVPTMFSPTDLMKRRYPHIYHIDCQHYHDLSTLARELQILEPAMM